MRTDESTSGSEARPSLASVVVCTHNRAAMAQRLLRSLAEQTVAPECYEIVLVDDGSTDGTAAMCRRLRGEIHNLRYVSAGTQGGTARARNLGVAAARGSKYGRRPRALALSRKSVSSASRGALRNGPTSSSRLRRKPALAFPIQSTRPALRQGKRR